MAVTKYSFYTSLIFIVGIFSLLLYNIGIASFNSDLVTLDNDSLEYVSSYSSYYTTQTGFSDFKDQQVGNTASIELLTGSNETGEILATDNFALPKATQGSIAKLPNFFKLAYNVPNLMLISLRVPTDGFEDYINVGTYIMSFSLLILFVKMTFNGGND